ncbi:MAG: PaaI family thioesterase [Dehalococcoidia bacterium]|nr:PaaI family thioesterase [Dehalococcoidia bacterium]
MTNWPQVSIDTEKELTMCFACGRENPIGLKLSFEWDGKAAVAEFTPGKFHQGWSGLVHGGIISCILDEAMSYATLFKGVNTLTAKMQTRFRRPARIDEPLIITASLIKKTRRLAEAKAEVSLKDGTPVADSIATMFILNQREGKAKSNV